MRLITQNRQSGIIQKQHRTQSNSSRIKYGTRSIGAYRRAPDDEITHSAGRMYVCMYVCMYVFRMHTVHQGSVSRASVEIFVFTWHLITRLRLEGLRVQLFPHDEWRRGF